MTELAARESRDSFAWLMGVRAGTVELRPGSISKVSVRAQLSDQPGISGPCSGRAPFHFRGHTCSKSELWDRFDDDRASPDNRRIAYIGHDNGVRTDPGVRTDADPTESLRLLLVGELLVSVGPMLSPAAKNLYTIG